MIKQQLHQANEDGTRQGARDQVPNSVDPQLCVGTNRPAVKILPTECENRKE